MSNVLQKENTNDLPQSFLPQICYFILLIIYKVYKLFPSYFFSFKLVKVFCFNICLKMEHCNRLLKLIIYTAVIKIAICLTGVQIQLASCKTHYLFCRYSLTRDTSDSVGRSLLIQQLDLSFCPSEPNSDPNKLCSHNLELFNSTQKFNYGEPTHNRTKTAIRIKYVDMSINTYLRLGFFA